MAYRTKRTCGLVPFPAAEKSVPFELCLGRILTQVHYGDPGQIELYSHIPVLRTFVDQLKRWDFNVCAVYLLDSQVALFPPLLFPGKITESAYVF